MTLPPDKIDNAEVLEFAWSDIPFGVVKYENGEIADYIHGLAICRYPDSDVYYRFSCNKDWETVQDSNYESIERAKELIPMQYRKSNFFWNKNMEASKSMPRSSDAPRDL
jgi:hypothetical protein